MKTREELLDGLEEEYRKKYSGNGYPIEFKPAGFISQCNFGGILIIVGNTCESALVWTDLSDNLVDESFTECEIEEIIDEDLLEPVSAVKFKGTYYALYKFMLIAK